VTIERITYLCYPPEQPRINMSVDYKKHRILSLKTAAADANKYDLDSKMHLSRNESALPISDERLTRSIQTLLMVAGAHKQPSRIRTVSAWLFDRICFTLIERRKAWEIRS
jgi:hypothetical protein